MADHGLRSDVQGLELHGIFQPGDVFWNLSVPALYEHSIRRHESTLVSPGPLLVHTGHHTGRSPRDKFVVREASSEEHIWWGSVNQPLQPDKFDGLLDRLSRHMQGKDLYVQDCHIGTDPAYRLPIRVITEYAWHSLFARHMFIRPEPEELSRHAPQFTVIDAPEFHAIPAKDGTRTEVFCVINFARRLILIGGTSYSGEIKKSIFTIMNYLMPLRGVLPMHCSANIGPDGDVAIFFGLSGTGKTTLSSDPVRQLIGDDEHGWSDSGVFNFEGGSYAKVIKLSKEAEPEIYAASHRFGTILENVCFDPDTRLPDFNDGSLTENSRSSYPIDYFPNVLPSGMAGHPRNVVFLTADAFGVLPPIARLTTEQAMYHFLLGYTSRIAGTEKGVTEPAATFSTCFGAPFLPQHPTVYSRLLGERLAQHRSDVWLVNTGWSGGPYGVGKRVKILLTRAMIRAALDGRLAQVQTEQEPNFGLHVPTACPGVPSELLMPAATWEDQAAYAAQARRVAHLMASAFEPFAAAAPPEVRAAGPRTN